MKKTKLLGFFILGGCCTLLSGCFSKNVWNLDYDLSDKAGRQSHCYAQFQKKNKGKEYGIKWVSEVEFQNSIIVEGRAKANDKEYNLVCVYPIDSGDIKNWEINTTKVEENNAIGDPAAEYCNSNGGKFEIVSEGARTYGKCTLENGTSCEGWKYLKGECTNSLFKLRGRNTSTTNGNRQTNYFNYNRNNTSNSESNSQTSHFNYGRNNTSNSGSNSQTSHFNYGRNNTSNSEDDQTNPSNSGIKFFQGNAD